MLDEGARWPSRGVVGLVAGHVTATPATMLIAVVMLAALPPTRFQDGADVRPRPRPGGVNVLVTVLIGVMLVDFPGKRPLEQKLVAQPRLLETMNRVRAWLGRPPLLR